MRIRILAAAAALAACATAQAVPVQWTVASGGNGHWYDIIALNGFTWDEAFADAPTRSHMGMTGYVATVTSAGEQRFVTANFTPTAWLGGNDRATEGTFEWKNGPEAGQAFLFAAWAPGEPNNCCSGEDDVVINWSNGGWNDIGLPSFPDYRVPYIVEYSPSVPEPGALVLVAMGLLGLAARRRRSNA